MLLIWGLIRGLTPGLFQTFTAALCWPCRRNTVDAHTLLCRPCPRSHAPFYSLSQFFFLIGVWTVYYQHVSDPLVSQGCSVTVSETQTSEQVQQKQNGAEKRWTEKKWIISSKRDLGKKLRVSHHCSLCDGAKTVDENIAGHIHGWAWRQKHKILVTYQFTVLYLDNPRQKSQPSR